MTNEELAEFIRLRRKAAGLSQRQLADRANVSQSLIAKYESSRMIAFRGDPKITAEMFWVIVEAMGYEITIKRRF